MKQRDYFNLAIYTFRVFGSKVQELTNYNYVQTNVLRFRIALSSRMLKMVQNRIITNRRLVCRILKRRHELSHDVQSGVIFHESRNCIIRNSPMGYLLIPPPTQASYQLYCSVQCCQAPGITITQNFWLKYCFHQEARNELWKFERQFSWGGLTADEV